MKSKIYSLFILSIIATYSEPALSKQLHFNKTKQTQQTFYQYTFSTKSGKTETLSFTLGNNLIIESNNRFTRLKRTALSKQVANKVRQISDTSNTQLNIQIQQDFNRYLKMRAAQLPEGLTINFGKANGKWGHFIRWTNFQTTGSKNYKPTNDRIPFKIETINKAAQTCL